MSTYDTKLEKAVRNPTAVYQTPEDVLSDPQLDGDAKRAILKSWELDARELAVAESENMAGGEPNMLSRVLAALAEIDASRTEDEAESAKVPTVHGLAPRGGVPEPDSPDEGGMDMNSEDEKRKTGRNEGGRNEGEGSRTAAREYNKDQQEFVKSGKVDEAARKAKKAVEGKEGKTLRDAEEAGRSHAKEQDPAVERDYRKPTR